MLFLLVMVVHTYGIKMYTVIVMTDMAKSRLLKLRKIHGMPNERTYMDVLICLGTAEEFWYSRSK